jgi:hypothetical protein
MKSLVSSIQTRAKRVRVSRGWVCLRLEDNREIRFPIGKSRRLQDGDPDAVRNVELICNGTGLHWPELDEDLSVQGILEGRFGYEG